MTKPVLVVTTRYTKEVEDRIDRDYNARRNPNQHPFLLPHIGSATIATRTAMGMLVLDNVEAVLNGRAAPTLVPNRSRKIA